LTQLNYCLFFYRTTFKWQGYAKQSKMCASSLSYESSGCNICDFKVDVGPNWEIRQNKYTSFFVDVYSDLESVLLDGYCDI